VAFYADEGSFYRQPTQAWLWHDMGRRQPRLHYCNRANTLMRVVGFLHPFTGQVHTWDYRQVTAAHFAQTLKQMAGLYHQYEKIFIILDNWPVHFHAKVRQVLDQEPRLELVPLPTYSPWLNPIEKVWKWCRQTLTHAHPWADDFLQFRQRVRDQFKSLQFGSNEIMAYTGLLK